MSIAEKLSTIAENEPRVYDAGKQEAYDAFWDALQQNGQRNFYDQMFQSAAWTDEVFHPKYDILCEGGEGARQVFYRTYITSTKVPIRCKNTRLSYTFYACTTLKTIPLLTLEGITQINGAFTQCNALENITIEGVIPLSIDFQWSTKLTKESILSITDHLNSDPSVGTGLTLTLSQTAVDNAFGYYDEDTGTTIPGSESSEWDSIVTNNMECWTIALI